MNLEINFDRRRLIKLGICILVAILLWLLTGHQGAPPQGWHIFSMFTAHISAMVAILFAVVAATSGPAMLTVAMFAYFSCLCGCLTNYSTGSVVIYNGFGYIKPHKWFSRGPIISLYYIVIWMGVGLIWWKILGWY